MGPRSLHSSTRRGLLALFWVLLAPSLLTFWVRVCRVSLDHVRLRPFELLDSVGIRNCAILVHLSKIEGPSQSNYQLVRPSRWTHPCLFGWFGSRPLMCATCKHKLTNNCGSSAKLHHASIAVHPTDKMPYILVWLKLADLTKAYQPLPAVC